MGAIDLSELNSQEQEVVSDTPQLEEVQWAFLVYKTKDGETIMHHDINHPISPERDPHPDDIHGACATVMADIAIMKSAGHIANTTINGLMYTQQQLAAQLQQERLTQQLARQKMRG